MVVFVFFFQAEDGIRDIGVTGVQTCALPIFDRQPARQVDRTGRDLGPRPSEQPGHSATVHAPPLARRLASGMPPRFRHDDLGPWLTDPDKVRRWDAIMVHKLDRLTRSLIDFIALLD